MKSRRERTEPHERLAKEIHAELIRQDLTPADLTETLGLSKATMTRRLNGEVPFTVVEVMEISSWLDVPFQELLTRSDAQRRGQRHD